MGWLSSFLRAATVVACLTLDEIASLLILYGDFVINELLFPWRSLRFVSNVRLW